MEVANRTSTHPVAAPESHVATALRPAEHTLASQPLEDCGQTRSMAKRRPVVKIRMEPSVRAQIEEERFSSVVKAVHKEHEQGPEASFEQAAIKKRIARIEVIERDRRMHEATIDVRCEHMKHHVSEEQGGMFPKVFAAGLDMAEPYAGRTAGKAELLAGRA